LPFDNVLVKLKEKEGFGLEEYQQNKDLQRIIERSLEKKFQLSGALFPFLRG